MKKGTKILIGITLIATLLGLKPMTPKAETLNYDFNSYAVRNNGTWGSQGPFGTSNRSKVMNGLSIRLGVDNQFRAGTTYRVIYMVGYADITIALEDILVTQPSSVNCYGSTQYSSWSNDAGLIGTCEFIGASRVPNTNQIRYIIEFSPVQNIKGEQTIFNFSNDRYTLSAINVYTTTSITYPQDVSSSIIESTVIIEEKIDDIMNMEHDYNQEDITGNVEDLETTNELIQQTLDLTTQDKLTFWWNTTYVSWIWGQAANLILNNYYFTTIMTSFMALGIIKLVLGR